MPNKESATKDAHILIIVEINLYWANTTAFPSVSDRSLYWADTLYWANTTAFRKGVW